MKLRPSTRFETQRVGALPVITDYFDTLQIAATVDDLVPWEGEVPLGTLVEIFIANRLLQPKAMFRIGQWAEQAGVTDYYDLTAEQLNDDRLGRALERIARHGPAVQSALVLSMVNQFDLQVNQIHYDVSNAELFGAYERQIAAASATFPKPAYGRTKSGRKNVKQIQFGLNVTRDGAVPVALLPLDGNAGEAPSHLENLKLLDRVLPKDNFLYLGDSKLDSDENLLAIAARKGKFLSAGAFLPHLQNEFLKQRKNLKEIDYYPQSQAKLPPEERDQYQAFEVRKQILGEVDGRGVRLKYRLIFVWSEAKERQEAETRERHLAKIREEFETVERNLNKYNLKTEDAIIRRLERVKGRYAIGSVFEYQLKKNRRGQFTLQWDINRKELKRRRDIEGVYVLKTNLPKSTHPTVEVLRTYKDQIHVERRIANLKGPLAVTPMFLEKPERMAGLLYILVWSLSVLALMERAVRRSLKGKPIYGLYPENRPSTAPTGTLLLDSFAPLCVVIVKDHGETSRRLADLTPIQRQLINLMGIPPDRLRTFKRRCGM
jgi:transposase